MTFIELPHSTFRAYYDHSHFGDKEVKALRDSESNHTAKSDSRAWVLSYYVRPFLINLFRKDFEIPTDWFIGLGICLK